MLRFSNLICGAAIVLAAVPAFAQRGQGGGGGRGGGGRGGQSRAMVELVSNAALQTELGATDEQKTKLTTLNEAVTAKRTELATGAPAFPMNFMDMTAEERAKYQAESTAFQAKVVKQLDTDFKAQLTAALDATQLKRLQQVYVQFLGVPGALTHEEVVAALALDQAQKDKIKAAIDEYNAANPGGRGAGGGGGRGANQEAQDARDTKILALLTEAQKKKYEELKGPAFDVAQLRGGRGGAGGGGGGGRRGAGGAGGAGGA